MMEQTHGKIEQIPAVFAVFAVSLVLASGGSAFPTTSGVPAKIAGTAQQKEGSQQLYILALT